MKKDDVISAWLKQNTRWWLCQRWSQEKEDGSTNVQNVIMKDGLSHTEQLQKVCTDYLIQMTL